MSPKDTVPTKISPPALYPVNTSQSIPAPLTSPPPAYPAVLVGRSSSESKAKVPPPVPPRGTQKVKRADSNGKGAHCLGNSFVVHANMLNFPLNRVDSPYYFSSPPMQCSRTRRKSRALKRGSLVHLYGYNGYFCDIACSYTSFSDGDEMEYFV